MKNVFAVTIMVFCLLAAYTLLKATFTNNSLHETRAPIFISDHTPSKNNTKYITDYTKLETETSVKKEHEQRVDTVTQEEIMNTVGPKRYTELDYKIAATLGITLSEIEPPKESAHAPDEKINIL